MMKRLLPLLAACLLCDCQHQTTRITNLADLPVKSEVAPKLEWETSPLRANAQYILFEANSGRSRKLLKGDYYFLTWYDAEPQKPVRIVMHYTQASTGSLVKHRTVEYSQPREAPGSHKERFFFNGPEREKQGDIMTWCIELYCDGQLRDSRRSYLWQ